MPTSVLPRTARTLPDTRYVESVNLEEQHEVARRNGCEKATVGLAEQIALISLRLLTVTPAWP